MCIALLAFIVCTSTTENLRLRTFLSLTKCFVVFRKAPVLIVAALARPEFTKRLLSPPPAKAIWNAVYSFP